MNVHDWSRVDDNFFHSFHVTWSVYLAGALNGGLLPRDYYARVEQHVGPTIPDILTLRLPPRPGRGKKRPSDAGGTLVAELTEPTAMTTARYSPGTRTRRRTVVVRQTGEDGLVAAVELVSAANKDREETAAEFVGKVGMLLRSGIHVAVLDLLPPNRHTPGGFHRGIMSEFRMPTDTRAQPADRPVAFLSYQSDMPDFVAYLNYLAVGDAIPELPLFLTDEVYVNLPLAATYKQSFDGMGQIDRDRLTGSG